jgi:hypothetical protein
MGLARYDVSGELDPAFGSQGTGMIDYVAPTQWWTWATAVVIRSQGDILVGGASIDRDDAGNLGDSLVGLWRFTADGILDETFRDRGWVSESFTSDTRTQCNGLVLADEKIVLAGPVSTGGVAYVGLMRFWQ